MVKEWILLEEANGLDFKLEVGRFHSLLAVLQIESEVLSKVKTLQQTNLEI